MSKGIIFDFNGTLYDDTDLQEEAWAVVFRKYLHRDIGPHEFEECLHGLANPDILTYLNHLKPEQPLTIGITDEKEAIYRDICYNQPERVHFIPGVTELFDQLTAENIPFAIATASEINNVNFYFEMFGLEKWFTRERVVYDTRTFPCKPAPDIFLEAARRLALPPQDCIVCEDSLNGIIAASTAGIGKVIARKPVLKAEQIIHDPRVFAVIDDFTNFYSRFMLED